MKSKDLVSSIRRIVSERLAIPADRIVIDNLDEASVPNELGYDIATGEWKIVFRTSATTNTGIVTGNGPIGVVVWLPREVVAEAIRD